MSTKSVLPYAVRALDKPKSGPLAALAQELQDQLKAVAEEVERTPGAEDKVREAMSALDRQLLRICPEIGPVVRQLLLLAAAPVLMKAAAAGEDCSAAEFAGEMDALTDNVDALAERLRGKLPPTQHAALCFGLSFLKAFPVALAHCARLPEGTTQAERESAGKAAALEAMCRGFAPITIVGLKSAEARQAGGKARRNDDSPRPEIRSMRDRGMTEAQITFELWRSGVRIKGSNFKLPPGWKLPDVEISAPAGKKQGWKPGGMTGADRDAWDRLAELVKSTLRR